MQILKLCRKFESKQNTKETKIKNSDFRFETEMNNVSVSGKIDITHHPDGRTYIIEWNWES